MKAHGLDTDLSWLLSIGQAIWRINGDEIYIDLLRKLQVHPGPNMKAAHLDQVTDLKDKERIEMLLNFLKDKDSLVKHLALSKLNYITSGKHAFENGFDKKYYLARQHNEDFKSTLLLNLQQLP